MLYITRKIGESVVIENEITVKIIDITGKTVKLGFESPDDATILRQELHDKIQAENLKAINSISEVEEDVTE